MARITIMGPSGRQERQLFRHNSLGRHPRNTHQVLDRVVSLPLREWSYRGQQARHLGPMAEDFHAAFGLGESATGLSTLDTSGVALAAIQGLNQRLQQKDAEIDRLEDEVAALRDQLEAVLARLE